MSKGLEKTLEEILGRLEQILPPPPPSTDWKASIAFRWRKGGRREGWLQPVRHVHRMKLSDLQGIQPQIEKVERNTRQFLEGKPANNVLLTGARGTGKSSIVKGLLNKYAAKGLRLIEVEKSDLADLPAIVDLVAGRPEHFAKFAGPARNKVAEELGLIDKDRFELCWIVDFPMYEWSEEEKKIDFSHNPFSMPNMPVDEFLALDPNDTEKLLSIKAIQYDIVCNGIELSSGALRNHRPDVMKKAFAIAGYPEQVLEEKFGGMLRALSLGAPPHGGIAPGIDRIVMLLCGEENLREVVLFPMNQRAEDLLMGAPSEVTAKQLRELHIRLALPEKN